MRMLKPTSKGLIDFFRWMAALLDCLRALGGSAKPKEVSSWIARELQLPPEIIEATVKSGANKFHNEVQWAKQYLVWDGLLDNSKRGIWALSPAGWKTHLDLESAQAIYQKINQSQREQKAKGATVPASEITEVISEETQELELLDILKALPPYGFELICGRLLREHGFEDVEVTQRSRDGGIDGYGLLRLSPFVSLRVAFQAKRYKDVVNRSDVGEFRNAVLGRAEKGVFITTGRFTADAEAEATREGVVPIELIDGEQLVELFQDKLIGVKPKTVYEIDHVFFDEFRRES
jgi:restriction system protein